MLVFACFKFYLSIDSFTLGGLFDIISGHFWLNVTQLFFEKLILWKKFLKNTFYSFFNGSLVHDIILYIYFFSVFFFYKNP